MLWLVRICRCTQSRFSPKAVQKRHPVEGDGIPMVQEDIIMATEGNPGTPYLLPLGKELTLSLVWVPAGTFHIGSLATEEGHEDEESPRHRVTLTHGFWLGRHPVTQGQWQAAMGANPSRMVQPDHPVAMVSWLDAQGFLKTLAGLVPGWWFRLPTEAEWEYACRADTETQFSLGDTEDDLARSAWFAANSDGATHPVATKVPNAWGLFDMHGNVFEWCDDWETSYTGDDAIDPRGPSLGQNRVLRGGCFKCPPPYCRSANRYSAPPDRRSPSIGFRLVAERMK